MEQQAEQNKDRGDGAFHEDFNPGNQAEEHLWNEVNNKKQSVKGGKAKEKETIKIRGFKWKMEIDNAMDTTPQEAEEHTKEMVNDQLQRAGERDIEEVLHKETTVMTRIAHVDDNVYVISIYTDEVWNDSSTFPSGEKFNEEFQIRQETSEE
eukprot:5788381-Ditylum_brightwellii.AAC.1